VSRLLENATSRSGSWMGRYGQSDIHEMTGVVRHPANRDQGMPAWRCAGPQPCPNRRSHPVSADENVATDRAAVRHVQSDACSVDAEVNRPRVERDPFRAHRVEQHAVQTLPRYDQRS
jgi:hypothetical protein